LPLTYPSPLRSKDILPNLTTARSRGLLLNASNPKNAFRDPRPLPNEDYVVSMGREEFFKKLLEPLKRRFVRG